MLPSAVHLLPTPTSQDSVSSGGSKPSNTTLTDAVVREDMGRQDNHRHSLLPTPTASPYGSSRSMSDGAARRPSLTGATANLLPTPRASSQGSSRQAMTRQGHWTAPSLEQALELPREFDTWDQAPGHSSEQADNGSPWGKYAPAIERWARTIHREPPPPTEPGKKGGRRLSPKFVEWMQGLPAGHVTNVPGISHNDQLKALGNGVVPQQVAATTRAFLADTGWSP